MTLDALIFDVDGTLAETEEVHRQAFNRAFSEAGLDWHWDSETYGRLLTVSGGKERIRMFSPESGDELVGRLHRRKVQHYTSMTASGALVLRPGIETLIAEARRAGIRLAIATTSSHASVDALLAERLDWFDVVVCTEDAPVKKPDPQAYLVALERLKFAPGNCLAVEDSGNGVRAARAAGLAVVVCRSAYTEGEDFTGALATYPDFSAVDLGDLKALLG